MEQRTWTSNAPTAKTETEEKMQSAQQLITIEKYKNVRQNHGELEDKNSARPMIAPIVGSNEGQGFPT